MINSFQISSPAFKEQGDIPRQYTCKGENINPPLNIVNVPENAKSLALIMHDPDAVNEDYIHWIMWDIPPKTQNIGPNSVPVGAIQGFNSSGSHLYIGPCPPIGTGNHRYMFEFFALDTTLGLFSDSSREQLEQAMQNHIIEKNILTGFVAADN